MSTQDLDGGKKTKAASGKQEAAKSAESTSQLSPLKQVELVLGLLTDIEGVDVLTGVNVKGNLVVVLTQFTLDKEGKVQELAPKEKVG